MSHIISPRRSTPTRSATYAATSYTATLPDPDVIAAEIADDLQAALDAFAAIAVDLRA